MRNLAIITAVLFLAACSGDEHQDLKEELKNLSKDLRGRIDPLPVVKPYEPVPYRAFELPDPFGSAKIELAIAAASKSKGGANAPNAVRPKEPLEAYPLESLKMVGTLSQKGVTFALVRADSSVYRVKAGNYLDRISVSSPESPTIRSTSKSWCRMHLAIGLSARSRCR
jgi:type IV pilus assembly protein PilP